MKLFIRKSFLSLIAVLAINSVSGAEREKSISQYSYRVWQRDQGLPQNSVNCMLQTRDGYLWLGTQEGLVRFDGVQFVVFDRRTNPAFHSNYIWSLYEDRDGRLWIGTAAGGIVTLDRNHFTFRSLGQDYNGNAVWSFLQDRDAAMWIGTSRGAFRAGSTDPFNPVLVAGTDSLDINSISLDAAGTVWGGTNRGLRRLGGVPATVPEQLARSSIRSLLQDNDGTLWLSTERDGVFSLRNSNAVRLELPKDLAGVSVFCMVRDQSGAMWLGTAGRGIRRYDGSRWSEFTSADGLSDNQVRCLLVDREHNIWLGTYGGGLGKLTDGSFTTYGMREGLSNSFVLTLAEHNGAMLAGTYGGGVFQVSNGRFTPLTGHLNLTTGVITSLAGDRTGNLWVAEFERGLHKLGPRGANNFFGKARGLTSPSVLSMACDRQNRMWIGTAQDMFRIDGETVQSVTRGLGSVFSLIEDRRGRIIAGTSTGVFRFDGNMPVPLPLSDVLAGKAAIALLEEENGTLWIGTDGAGLIRYRDSVAAVITPAQGLFDDVVFSILDDGLGGLWMSSNNGVFNVRKSALNDYFSGSKARIPCEIFGPSDGLKNSECNGRRQPSAAIDRNGNLWFATPVGASVIDPHSIIRNTVAPNVIVEEIRFDNESFATDSAIVVGPGVSSFEIRYTATSFIAPRRLGFRYLLEGFDRNWVDADSRRVAYYTNIPPGEYRFHVAARNEDGLWNVEGATTIIHLRPYFYQTTWFLAGLLLCGIIAVAGTVLWRIRAQRAREQELIELVEERTARLSEEKKKAEEALVWTEEARRESERQRELAQEANKVKTHLLHLAAHDLKSPLISIKGFTQIIREEAPSESSVGKMAEMIHTLSSNMIQLVNQLLGSATIETGKVILLKNRVDLTQVARTIILNNFLTAKGKGQKFDLRLDQPGACLVEGDEARLRDACENLITNAVKYSPLGTSIEVTVTRSEPFVRFIVRDHGPGLTAEDKQNLFTKFRPLSAKPTGGESSTGLGLSITKEIVDLHGGRVLVESEAGAGSTFMIELPALPPIAAV